MEFYLVQESVKVAENKEAFQRTEEYEELISRFDVRTNTGVDHKIFTLEDISVELNSFSIDENEKAEGFVEDVNRILKRPEQDFADVKLELIIFHGKEEVADRNGNKEKNFHGYFLLSGMEQSNSEENTVNIIERLEHAFGENEVHFDIELSLVHLSTRDTPVSLDSAFTLNLKAFNLEYVALPHRIGGKIDRIPEVIRDFWRHKSCFTHVKLSIKVEVDEDAADYFLKFGASRSSSTSNLIDLNRKLMEDGISMDLEIRCINGAAVKCHSAFLAANSKKLEKELKGSKGRGVPLILKMGDESVKPFLEWVYCKRVTKAMENSDVALELLKAGRMYEVKELETEMEKVLMSKGVKDLKYFSVEAALKLYLYVKDDEELKGLRDKAVRVLKNYTRAAGDKLNESAEYVNFFRNDPQEAMKLSHLYGRLA